MVGQKMAQSSLRHNWLNRFPLLRLRAPSTATLESTDSHTPRKNSAFIPLPLSWTRGSQRCNTYLKKNDFRCCPRRFVLERTGRFLESTQRFYILQVLCSHTEVIMLVEDTQLTGLEAAAPTCPSVALPDESDHNLISITTASRAQTAPAAFTLRKLYASGVFCGHEDGLR